MAASAPSRERRPSANRARQKASRPHVAARSRKVVAVSSLALFVGIGATIAVNATQAVATAEDSATSTTSTVVTATSTAVVATTSSPDWSAASVEAPVSPSVPASPHSSSSGS